MNEIITITKAKARLSDLIRRLIYQKHKIVITKKGKKVAVMMSFDEGTAKIYGKLKARLKKKGMVKSEPYLRIASVAIQHKLILVTGNTQHFDDIPGLEVENWIVD